MACRLAGLSRSAYRRALKADTATDPDAALRAWLRDSAKAHPRWGYRRAYHDAWAEAWGVDFQFDVHEAGRAIKIASIVDEHTRECIGGLVERSITADRLADHLDDLVAQRARQQFAL